MDAEYREIYGQLVTDYTQAMGAAAPPGLPDAPHDRATVARESLQLVGAAVGEAVAKVRAQLRPDGVLFLVSSLHLLVSYPVIVRMRNDPEVQLDVHQMLVSDVVRILEHAKERLPSDRSELAASHVLWGSAEVLDDLQLKEARIWDRD